MRRLFWLQNREWITSEGMHYILPGAIVSLIFSVLTTGMGQMVFIIITLCLVVEIALRIDKTGVGAFPPEHYISDPVELAQTKKDCEIWGRFLSGASKCHYFSVLAWAIAIFTVIIGLGMLFIVNGSVRGVPAVILGIGGVMYVVGTYQARPRMGSVVPVGYSPPFTPNNFIIGKAKDTLLKVRAGVRLQMSGLTQDIISIRFGYRDKACEVLVHYNPSPVAEHYDSSIKAAKEDLARMETLLQRQPEAELFMRDQDQRPEISLEQLQAAMSRTSRLPENDQASDCDEHRDPPVN